MKTPLVRGFSIYIRMRSKIINCILFLTLFSVSASELPEGFVYVEEIIPDIILDMRYHGSNNFVGESINGYNDSKCILTIDAVNKLKTVQNELRYFGLGLIIFDAYRPQMAVDHFIEWSKSKDNRMKEKYYPDVAKEDLFAKGYIASRSGHSRGSTVDLSIVSLKDKKELDMGTEYDFFSIISWPSSMDINEDQRSNRMLLQILMKKNGFMPLKEEWWHFTMVDEPFPDTYFNFPVK